MTYKQIEASREARLWIGQVIVPAATAVITLSSVPEVRHTVSTNVKKFKNAVKKKFHKD